MVLHRLSLPIEAYGLCGRVTSLWPIQTINFHNMEFESSKGESVCEMVFIVICLQMSHNLTTSLTGHSFCLYLKWLTLI